ncbi:hypothetical protein [Streptosporangium vulgare]|uniref:Uncharacterized protein n=1 Tax=Streptosporangium vulgare TaxID=46190 RepID=A0ABV5TR67_9ACTN
MAVGDRRASGPAPAPVTGRAPGAAAIVGFTIGLALVTYLWRVVVPMGVSILGLPTPAYLPQYAALFNVGLIATRRGWPEGLSRTAGRAGFATAAVATVALLLVLVSAGEAILGHGTLPSLIAATCESALAVGIILGLLVLFREPGRARTWYAPCRAPGRCSRPWFSSRVSGLRAPRRPMPDGAAPDNGLTRSGDAWHRSTGRRRL